MTTFSTSVELVPLMCVSNDDFNLLNDLHSTIYYPLNYLLNYPVYYMCTI